MPLLRQLKYITKERSISMVHPHTIQPSKTSPSSYYPPKKKNCGGNYSIPFLIAFQSPTPCPSLTSLNYQPPRKNSLATLRFFLDPNPCIFQLMILKTPLSPILQTNSCKAQKPMKDLSFHLKYTLSITFVLLLLKGVTFWLTLTTLTFIEFKTN